MRREGRQIGRYRKAARRKRELRFAQLEDGPENTFLQGFQNRSTSGGLEGVLGRGDTLDRLSHVSAMPC